MIRRVVVLSAAIAIQAHAAWAQQDPCAPRVPGLFDAFTARQRVQACAAEREAQWREYNERRAKEAADLRAERQAAEAQASAEAERAQEQQAVEAARQKAELDLEAARAKAAQDAEAARIERQQQAEARQAVRARYLAYQGLLAAESSPENKCKTPDVARQVMNAWNEFDRFKAENQRVVDIDHLTTERFDPGAGVIACHGVFVTNQGNNIIGTFSTKKNVAGDVISAWEPDAAQDLSVYDPPPDPDPINAQATSSTQTIPVSANGAPGSGSFSAGLDDRKQWEAWVAGLSGPEREGAVWWASSRNSPHHDSCETAPSTVDATWKAGCVTALVKLTAIDSKRRADSEYRKGWNSF